MTHHVTFYFALLLIFTSAGSMLYRALSNEKDGLLGKHAQWLTDQAEFQFKGLTPFQAKLQILFSMLIVGVAFGFFLPIVLGFAIPFYCFILLVFGCWLGWKIPAWLARRRIEKRKREFEAQLVDALVLLANALRSGLSLLQGFKIVVAEMSPPISQEFELVLREQKLSAVLDDALLNMSNRLHIKDLDIVITAILTLRETGGSLPETFDTVTYTIRERKKVEGKIESLTALGMTQGIVACFLPFAFIALLGLMQPQLVRPLLTTTIGRICIFLAVVFDILGYIFIKKTVTITV